MELVSANDFKIIRDDKGDLGRDKIGIFVGILT